MRKPTLSILSTLWLISIANANPIDTLPPEAILYAALDTFHAQTLRAELAEFKETRRGSWIDYLPSISYTTNTLSGKPAPGITYSTAQVRATRNRRKSLKAKRQSIITNSAIRRNVDRRRLRNLIQKHAIYKEELAAMEQIYQLDIKLWEFYQTAYEKGDLKPIEYITREKEFLSRRRILMEQRQRTQFLVLDILEAAHYFL